MQTYTIITFGGRTKRTTAKMEVTVWPKWNKKKNTAHESAMNEPQCFFFCCTSFFFGMSIDKMCTVTVSFHRNALPKTFTACSKKNILAVCKLQIGKQHAEYVNRRNSKWILFFPCLISALTHDYFYMRTIGIRRCERDCFDELIPQRSE